MIKNLFQHDRDEMRLPLRHSIMRTAPLAFIAPDEAVPHLFPYILRINLAADLPVSQTAFTVKNTALKSIGRTGLFTFAAGTTMQRVVLRLQMDGRFHPRREGQDLYMKAAAKRLCI